MKYLQEDYWGDDAWTQMYALRSAVEADDELIESLLIRGQQVIDFAATHDPIAA